jgi:NADH-quinone oxidoreductase subunit B
MSPGEVVRLAFGLVRVPLGRDDGVKRALELGSAAPPRRIRNRTSCAAADLPVIRPNATNSGMTLRGPVALCKVAVHMDEGLRSELSKQGIFTTRLEDLYNWGRKNSVWPLQFGLACCAIEMIATTMARYDLARFGAEVFRPSPRQADLMIVAGTVTKKMAPQVVRLFNQMPEPKYVIAMGACAISGGPFKQGYNVLKGIDRYIPVDVHIPGCPPRPEALIHAFMTLQKKIDEQTLTGPHRARHLDPTVASEFAIPQFGAHDLVPPSNPEVWEPPTLTR